MLIVSILWDAEAQTRNKSGGSQCHSQDQGTKTTPGEDLRGDPELQLQYKKLRDKELARVKKRRA